VKLKCLFVSHLLSRALFPEPNPNSREGQNPFLARGRPWPQWSPVVPDACLWHRLSTAQGLYTWPAPGFIPTLGLPPARTNPTLAFLVRKLFDFETTPSSYLGSARNGLAVKHTRTLFPTGHCPVRSLIC
jgi:hypothetical protein